MCLHIVKLVSWQRLVILLKEKFKKPDHSIPNSSPHAYKYNTRNHYRNPSHNFSPCFNSLKIHSSESIDLGGLNFKNLRAKLPINVQLRIQCSKCYNSRATSVQNFENGGETVRGITVSKKSKILKDISKVPYLWVIILQIWVLVFGVAAFWNNI